MSDAHEKAAEAAKSTAIATEDLLNEVFSIETIRSVQTKFGQRKIVTIFWPPESDEVQEAWLSGVVIDRQLDAIKDDLPAIFTLTRDSEPNSPYILVAPDEGAHEPVEAAAKKPGGKTGVCLADFRDENGKLMLKSFVGWWQDQGYGPDDLQDIIGENTGQALEQWFAADKTRTLETLLMAAQAGYDEPEELPFE